MQISMHTTPASLVPAADPILSAIEAHREAWSEFSAEATAYNRKGRRRITEAEFRAAREAYQANTDQLVAVKPVTMAGLLAFTAYLSGLQAYGRCATSPWAYAIEVWHLSDAMETVAEALARLAGPTAASLAH